jgi:hypothetical protein
MLKLNRSKDLLNPQISYYAQGMSFTNVPFDTVIRWTICKMTFPRGNLSIKSLNLPFIRFQQRIRSYFLLLRRVRNIRFLLRREIGLPPTGAL